MPFRPRHDRWSLRRTVLGIALVLHVLWLALAMPVAAAHGVGNTGADVLAGDGASTGTVASAAGMPCHEAMHTAPAHPPRPHMPCCSQDCACAGSLCVPARAAAAGAPLRRELRAPRDMFPAFHGREPAPELRPPILH